MKSIRASLAQRSVSPLQSLKRAPLLHLHRQPILCAAVLMEATSHITGLIMWSLKARAGLLHLEINGGNNSVWIGNERTAGRRDGGVGIEGRVHLASGSTQAFQLIFIYLFYAMLSLCSSYIIKTTQLPAFLHFSFVWRAVHEAIILRLISLLRHEKKKNTASSRTFKTISVIEWRKPEEPVRSWAAL